MMYLRIDVQMYLFHYPSHIAGTNVCMRASSCVCLLKRRTKWSASPIDTIWRDRLRTACCSWNSIPPHSSLSANTIWLLCIWKAPFEVTCTLHSVRKMPKPSKGRERRACSTNNTVANAPESCIREYLNWMRINPRPWDGFGTYTDNEWTNQPFKLNISNSAYLPGVYVLVIQPCLYGFR